MRLAAFLVCSLLIATNFIMGQTKGSFKVMLRATVPDVQKVTVKQLSTLSDSVVVLDARSPEEYAVSHIPGAVAVGYENFSLDLLPPMSKDQTIVVYCTVGVRSGKITRQLLEAGYVNTYNLYGGIIAWKNAGNTVVCQDMPTDSVHVFSRLWGIWLKNGQPVY